MTKTLARQFGATWHEADTPVEQGEKECEGVEIRFDAKSGTLLLGLGGQEKLDAKFLADTEKDGFSPKEEFHMTVIGFKQGNQLKQAIKQDPDLADKIAALAQSIEWGIKPTGERYK